MTTWSVVKDNTTEKRRPLRYFRYLLLACVAGLVISLGVALTPREPPAPPEPAFSEKARVSALDSSLSLRSAAQRLADSTSGAQQLAFSQLVTLLTTHSKALVLPGGSTTSEASASSQGSPTAVQPISAGDLVNSLAASGAQRTSDATVADGGMARLLAAVGASQLLQASSLAAANGIPQPQAQPEMPAAPQTRPEADLPLTGAQGCPTPSPVPSPAPDAGSASLAAALSTTVRTEAVTVYGYQVALTRLAGAAAASASELLAQHEKLLREAEDLSRLYCVDAPEQEPGYGLPPSFLESPAAGLGSLEAGTLPVYADLVALTEGPSRSWAIAGLLEATRRSAIWGTDPGPLPGVAISLDQLPPLPEDVGPSSTPSPSASLTGQEHP